MGTNGKQRLRQFSKKDGVQRVVKNFIFLKKFAGLFLSKYLMQNFRIYDQNGWKIAIGNRLELDGYCAELKIAFEYQGRQHFEIGFFGSTQLELDAQKSRDAEKKEICEANGVQLFIIHFSEDLRNLPNLIQEEFVKCNLDISNYNFDLPVDMSQAHNQKTKIELMGEWAEARGGRCLSNVYLGNKKKLRWECGSEHQWNAAPYSIQQGTWCPECAKKDTRLGIEYMHHIARENDGECLSNEYINAKVKLKWKCSKGHIWHAVSEHVMRGAWCKICANKKRRLDINEMQKMAIDREGKCLSETYVNTKSKLLWQCKNGHKWEAIPSNIRQGRWCPKCRTKTI